MAQMVSDFVNWLSGDAPKVEKFGMPCMQRGRAPCIKREYLTGPDQQAARGWETQWELPAVNPVLEVMSHGMEAGAPTNMVKRTSVSTDPRGEPDAIKNLTDVDLPNFLMNDRIYAGATERSDLRGLTTETMKYGS
jgi:hypothetical protein